jgi:hypothetical protein
MVRLHEACEDAKGVTWSWSSAIGELFDRIFARGHYTEQAAAKIGRTIAQVVQLYHDNGVMHRDLKPENFLFAGKFEDSPLNGSCISVFFKPGFCFYHQLQICICACRSCSKSPGMKFFSGPVHRGGRQRDLHGAGAAHEELRPGGGRLERHDDPVRLLAARGAEVTFFVNE